MTQQSPLPALTWLREFAEFTHRPFLGDFKRWPEAPHRGPFAVRETMRPAAALYLQDRVEVDPNSAMADQPLDELTDAASVGSGSPEPPRVEMRPDPREDPILDEQLAELAEREAAHDRQAVQRAACGASLTPAQRRQEQEAAAQARLAKAAAQGYITLSDARKYAELTGLDVQLVEAIIARAEAERSRRQEAETFHVLERACRGEFNSTPHPVRPLRHHGARSRAKRAAAPRRRGSRRCSRRTASVGSSSRGDPPEPEPPRQIYDDVTRRRQP